MAQDLRIGIRDSTESLLHYIDIEGLRWPTRRFMWPDCRRTGVYLCVRRLLERFSGKLHCGRLYFHKT